MSSFRHAVTKEERRMATYSYLDAHFSKILLFLFNPPQKQLFLKENNERIQGIRSRKRGSAWNFLGLRSSNQPYPQPLDHTFWSHEFLSTA